MHHFRGRKASRDEQVARAARKRWLKAARELASAQDWDDVRRTIAAHPVLLSDVSAELFESLISRLREAGDANGAASYGRYRDLIFLARRIGVEEAIAESLDDELSTELQAALGDLSASGSADDIGPQQLGLIRRALDLASPGETPKLWVSLHGMVGEALLSADGPSSDDAGDRRQTVEQAIEAFRTALSRQSRDAQPILWAITMNNVARAHAELAQDGAAEDRSLADAALRQALGVFTEEAGPRIISVEMERTLLLLADGTESDLRDAIGILRRTLELISEIASTGGAVHLPQVARLLGDEVRLSVGDGDGPVEVPGDAGGGDATWDLVARGASLLAEYFETGEVDLLQRALGPLGEAARSVDASSPHGAEVLGLLGTALWSRYDRVRDRQSREEATHAHRLALAVLPPGSPAHVGYLDTLSHGLRESHRRTGERESLDEAIELVAQAAALLTPASPRRAALLRRLGDYRLIRHGVSGDMADLDAGLASLRSAEELTRAGSADRIAVLANLSHALVLRYEQTGGIADLDQAIACDREALDLAPDRSPAQALLLDHASRSLQSRYEWSGRPADLDAAIQYARQALALAHGDGPDRPAQLVNLGLALNARYDLAMREEDLAECIDLIRQAVALCPPESDYRDAALVALSTVLRDRYFRTGDLADLAEVIELSRAALELTAPGTPGRWGPLMNLGVALRQRYERSTDLADLDEAIEYWREALDDDIGPAPFVRQAILSGLAVALLDRHKHTGGGEHLRDAVELAREVLARTAPSSPSYAPAADCLAAALMERSWVDGDRADLDQAETLLSTAMDLDQDSVHSRIFLPSSLARVLSNRYESDASGDPADLHAAQALFRQVVTSGLTLNPDFARVDSLAWGQWAARRESWSEAAQAYDYGLQAMERLFRAQLTRTSKESRLHDAQGLAVAAAYALARSGDTAQAAVAIERGRALMLSEALDRSRARLEHLAVIGRGDLVERYRSSAAVLDGLERQALAQAGIAGRVSPTPMTQSAPDLTGQLRSAQAELDAVLSAIRRIDGYRHFLEPPRLEDLRTAAATPLVYLAAADQCGLALIVTADGGDEVDVCWLPALTSAALRTWAGRYWQAYRSRANDHASWEQTLEATTRWLWDVLMEPVTAALGSCERAALVPAGLLGMLPLHAAWREDAAAPSGRRYALDDLLLSYVPNARTRTAAAEGARRAAPDGLLAIEDPRPVTAGPLPAAGREVRSAMAHFARSRSLSGERATRPAVLAALGEYPVLHFACHGFADAAEPLASGLLLACDESLSLRDLLVRGPLNARLAVLSACETAVPGADLPDEVINLPAGLLQAGIGGVVGSQWSVNDASTMVLMARFYELWRVDALDPAQALRRAQQWVRDTTNGAKRDRYPDIEELRGSRVPAQAKQLWEGARAHRAPWYWAAFVYVGE
ncbi:CHAT domain-containing protein [Kitasatospora nipponensis]|uniref:CHAT domain-containing protein n=1 Tax=Kitasatospora nipponensis TaxID=258049 RepID=A0ABP4HHG0_9ACTN